MTYGDESIIAARVATQEKKAYTISNEVIIDGCQYQGIRRGMNISLADKDL